ncbi:MAG: prepilin peptidase [Alphaproteobacteria bacterium]|nr:prepilin peptidase [Alphaproteobacteria bacterium]
MEVWVSNLPILFLAALSLAMLAVIFYDTREFIIPNTLVVAIAMLYLPGFYFLGLNPINGLTTGGIVLVLGMGLFALKVMGGGDIKLLAALALWTGWSTVTVNFLIYMAVFGGLFAVAVVVLRKFAIFLPVNLPRILRAGEPIPYGVAIALAFIMVLWDGQIFKFTL